MNRETAKHWIGHEWVVSESVRDSINPATSEVIGQYYEGGSTEADLAIRAATLAFKTSSWRHDKNLRAEVIERIAQRFEAYAEPLIDQLCEENGKLRAEATFEVNMVASKLRYYGALARAGKGEAAMPVPGAISVSLKEPVGVVGVIVPWNSPVVLAIRSMAPALAAGCTVAIKMPGQTAQTNTLFAQILSEVKELPSGVVNLFNEYGISGAQTLVSSPDTAAISFTGSTRTGAMIAAQAGQLLKRCGLELGGKSPHIIFNDANYEAMLPTLCHTVTIFGGQFCMAGSRIIVQEGIAEKVIEGIARFFSTIRPGPAADAASEIGPLIDKANVARVDAVVKHAIAQGAKVIVRGGPVMQGPLAAGAFYRPTLLQVDRQDLDIVQEETFGPVMTVQTFKTEEEALQLANDSKYGLAASVWTQNASCALRVASSLEAGTVWINDWAKVYDEFEEGGYKHSGLGRLNGPSAIDDFVEIKHIALSAQ